MRCAGATLRLEAVSGGRLQRQDAWSYCGSVHSTCSVSSARRRATSFWSPGREADDNRAAGRAVALLGQRSSNAVRGASKSAAEIRTRSSAGMPAKA